MKNLKLWACLVASLVVLIVFAPTVQATDISGTITTTRTIYDDSELVGDVNCNVPHAPCILFGAPHIKLRLNGFTITGPGGPPTNCTSTTIFFSEPEDGIDILQDGVSIIGPGRVRNFRRYGILLGSFAPGALPLKHVVLKRVTFSENCFSGLQTVGLDDSKIEENIFARNSGGSDGFSCGGT